MFETTTCRRPSILTALNVFCLLQVHVQAVLSILLATFAGFGVVMSGSSILVEYFRWRRRVQALSEQRHGPQLMPQAGQNPRTSNVQRPGPGSGSGLAPSNHSQPVVQNQQNSNQSWIDVFVASLNTRGCSWLIFILDLEVLIVYRELNFIYYYIFTRLLCTACGSSRVT